MDRTIENRLYDAFLSSTGVSGQYIAVDDTLEALQALARRHRSSFRIPVLGLTGTNGKTTTKELICAVLSAKYRVTATIGNLNNHIGVPLTLLRLTPETEIAVVEMGANHPGEIAAISRASAPSRGSSGPRASSTIICSAPETPSSSMPVTPTYAPWPPCGRTLRLSVTGWRLPESPYCR